MSLSNLIKATRVIPVEMHKQLEVLQKFESVKQLTEDTNVTAPYIPDQDTVNLRDQILSDAQYVAEEKLRDAQLESDRIIAEAQEQIEQWWAEKRAEDEELIHLATEEARAVGMLEGKEQATQEVNSNWKQKIDSASHLLLEAYEWKEQIIQESETFLVELSCAIAAKVIGKQLSEQEELAISFIKKALTTRREQGIITLCVAPERVVLVEAAREELQLLLDSQATLQIVPDSTVVDFGCVIRSEFGSVDARVDTQLAEIKRELLQVAHRSSEQGQGPTNYD
ncbi:FliH/SctL family protein [Paenibacillus yanchengensis]|uniref:FliH/SctL family protein n=1 Tax=Paenibacillus yanchengensis TaxID=2035833 RepID=A0ABW4YMG5_9BACL